jgi:hypothetical protein
MTIVDLTDLNALPDDTKLLLQTRHEEGWQPLLIVSLRRMRTTPRLLRHVERETRAVVLPPGARGPRPRPLN